MESQRATLEQSVKLLTLLAQKGITLERLQDHLEAGLLGDLIEADAKFIDRKEFQAVVGSRLNYTISVRYGRSIERGIESGRYDYVEWPAIREGIKCSNFLTLGVTLSPIKVPIKIVWARKDLYTGEVLGLLDKEGLRPGTMQELLALGEEEPDFQRRFKIVALGEKYKGYCPVLESDGRRRILTLDAIDPKWHHTIRFLAVPKSV